MRCMRLAASSTHSTPTSTFRPMYTTPRTEKQRVLPGPLTRTDDDNDGAEEEEEEDEDFDGAAEADKRRSGS